MIKVDHLLDLLEQLENPKKLNLKNNDSAVKSYSEVLKEASAVIESFSVSEISKNNSSASTYVLRFLALLVNNFDNSDANIRILAEQIYDSIIKKSVLGRSTEWAIRVVLRNLHNVDSGRAVVILLGRVEYLLSFIPISSGAQSSKFSILSNSIAICFLNILKRSEVIVHRAIETNFGQIYDQIQPDPKISQEIFVTSLDMLFQAKGPEARSTAEVLKCVSLNHRENSILIFTKCLEHIINCYENKEKPSLGALISMKNFMEVINYLEENQLEFQKKTIEILLLLITNSSNDVVFSAFTVLEEFLKNLPKKLLSFEPGCYLKNEILKSKPQPELTNDEVENGNIADELKIADEIIDPLLNPNLYEEILQQTKVKKPEVNFTLPSVKALIKDGISDTNLDMYIAAFLCKAFLLTGISGTLKNESESNDSMKILAFQCLLIIGNKRNLNEIIIIFDKREQALNDVAEFSLHHDEALASKAIFFIAQQFKYVELTNKNNFNKFIELIINKSNNCILKKRALLEAFCEERILNLQNNNLFERVLNLAWKLCESNDFADQNIASRFITSLKHLTNEKHQNLLEISRKKFLKLFETWDSTKSSSFFNNIPIVFKLNETSNDSWVLPGIPSLLNQCSTIRLIDTFSVSEEIEIKTTFLLTEIETMMLNDHAKLMPAYIEAFWNIEKSLKTTKQYYLKEFLNFFDLYSVRRSIFSTTCDLITTCCFEKLIDNVSAGKKYDKEIIHEITVLALRCLNMVNAIITENRFDQKYSNYSELAKLRKKVTPIRSNEEFIVFSKETENEYNHSQALLSLYSDLQGSYKNFKTSLNKNVDEKLIGFINDSSSLLCLSLEFLSLNEFSFFEETVFYLQKIIDVAPVPSLKIMRQLIKIVFSRNMNSIDSSFWLKFHTNLDFFTINQFDGIFNQNVDFVKNIIQFSMECLGIQEIKIKKQSNKQIIDSLTKLEDLITTMIRIFRCRGAEEKKQVILIMVELLQSGILHDMADPKNVIYNEVISNLSDPSQCMAPQLFETMISFLVVHSRTQSHNSQQLHDSGMQLLKSIPNLKQNHIKFAMAATCIAIMELISQDKNVDLLSSELSSMSEIALKHAPCETLYAWFLLLSSLKSENSENVSLSFMNSFLKWITEESSIDIPFKSLLLPLSRISSSAFPEYSDLCDVLMDKPDCNSKQKVALFCSVLFRVSEKTLCLMSNSDDQSFENFIQRIIMNILKNNEHSEKEIVINLLKIALKEFSPKLAESLNHFFEIDSEKTNSDCLKKQLTPQQSLAMTEINFFNADLSFDDIVITMANVNLEQCVRYVLPLEFEHFWKISSEIDQIFTTDAFWESLMKEFKQHNYLLETLSTPESQEISQKLHQLIEKSINFAEKNNSYEKLMKILANCEDMKIKLDELSENLINNLLIYVAEKGKKFVTNSYMYKSIIVILNNSEVKNRITKKPLSFVLSHLQLLTSLITVNLPLETYLKSLTDGISYKINNDIKFENIDSIKDLLNLIFIKCHQALNKDNYKKTDKEAVKNLMLRHPTIYPIFMICLPAVELGWKIFIEVKADGNIFVPLAKVHYLCNYEVLINFQMRQTRVGWLTKTQFEDICVTLLGVLSTTPTGKELENTSEEIVMDRIKCSSLAINIFTSVLLCSLKYPYNGDPYSKFVLKLKEWKTLTFGSGELNEFNAFLHMSKIFDHTSTPEVQKLIKQNISGMSESYGLAQVNVFSLWTICGVISSETGKPFSTVSSATTSKLKPSLSQHLFKTTSDLDTVSNVRSLLGIFSHWFSHGIHKLPSLLLSAVLQSLQYLSDFFDDLTTYDFLYTQMKIIHNGGLVQDTDDEGKVIALLLKSFSVLGFENVDSNMAPADKQKMVMSWIEIGLTNPYSSIQDVYTFSGIIYLMQSCSLDFLKKIIDYIAFILLDGNYLINENEMNGREVDKLVISVIQHILNELSESKVKELLLNRLVESLLKSSDNRQLFFLTTAIENLICSSISYIDFFMNAINEYLSTNKDGSRKNIHLHLSLFKIEMACIFKCSSSGNESAMEKVAYSTFHLTRIFFDRLEGVHQTGWVLRCLPVLLLTVDGVERTVSSQLEKLLNDTSEIKPRLMLYNETFAQIRNRKNWGRVLRNTISNFDLLLEKIKHQNSTVYFILRMSMSQKKENYSRVPLLISVFDTNVEFDTSLKDFE